MLRTDKNTTKKGVLVLALAVAMAFTGCQDDPEIVPVNDGIPVFTPKSKASNTLIQLNTYPNLDPNGVLWDTVDTDNGNDPFYYFPDIFFNITDPSPQPPVFWSQQSHF